MREKKGFYRYVIPSIISSFGIGVYYIAEGYMVGNWLGADALAAIGYAGPYTTALFAVLMLFSTGGAVIMSTQFGRGDTSEANRVFNISMVVMILFLAVTCGLPVCFPEEFSRMFGASEEMMPVAVEYLRWYMMMGFLFIYLPNGLTVFVRNDGSPKLSSAANIIGLIASLIFLFIALHVFDMGVKGSAIARGLGQAITMGILMLHFVKKKGVLRFERVHMDMKLLLRISKIGFPIFVVQMYSSVTQFCFNFVGGRAFGDIAVSAYTVVANITFMMVYVYSGLVQGMQPLISESHGAGDLAEQRKVLKQGLRMGIVIGVFFCIISVLWGEEMLSFFNDDPDLITIGGKCLMAYGFSFIFTAVNMVCTNYYQSTENVRESFILAVLRSFIFNVACIFAVPAIFGNDALWHSIIVSEALVTASVILLYKRIRKRERLGAAL